MSLYSVGATVPYVDIIARVAYVVTCLFKCSVRYPIRQRVLLSRLFCALKCIREVPYDSYSDFLHRSTCIFIELSDIM
jgi:hypothetical protein